MNNIINLINVFHEKRDEIMTFNTYEKLRMDLCDQKNYEDMPAVAESFLAQLPQSSYPTPVIHIARELGFKVFGVEMGDRELSGFIAVDDKWKRQFGTDKIIMVNQKDSNEHKRFTIAHELAHYLFDAVSGQEYYNTYRTDESRWQEHVAGQNDREAVANYFAANLLMPSLDFRRKYNELSKDAGVSDRAELTMGLSEFFGVPKTAVQIRYKELGIE